VSRAPLLSVEGVSLALPSGLGLVEDASFRLEAGEVAGIVGESGSGKTLLARGILGLLPPPVRATTGRILFDGADLLALPARSLRRYRGRRIGMVFQEPMTSLNPAISIGEQMAEGLRLHERLSGGEIRRRMVAMLERIRIPDPEACLSAYPHEFSGGMRQRIMLASVMLLRPALLIADEPTTALDCLVQREVLDLMLELTRSEGTAVLMISHDLAMVASRASRVVVMQQGRVVEQDSSERILLRPSHPYTRSLLAALPRRQPARPETEGRPTLLDIRDLSVVFPGRRGLLRRRAPKWAVDGVSLSIREGEILALVGGSGSGKTTLGRAVVRLVRPSGGQLLFRGADVFADGIDARRHALACQIVFQDPFASLDPRMRVDAVVAEPLRHEAGLDRAARRRRVAETLDEVGLGRDFLDRYPHQLSGGQRQRVAIARAIVRRPALLVADEPVSALDMTVQRQILGLLRSLQDRLGFACLFISHDLAAVEQVADRVAVMQDGRIVETAPRDALFDAPRHPYTRALLSAMPALEPQPDGGFRLRRRIAPEPERLRSHG